MGEKLGRIPSLEKTSHIATIARHKILDFHVVYLKLHSTTRVDTRYLISMLSIWSSTPPQELRDILGLAQTKDGEL